MELFLHPYVQQTQAEHLLQQVLIEREYQQAYIDSLKKIPTFKSASFKSASFNSLTIKRFIDHYPDFIPVFKGKVGRNFSFYMSEKVKNNEYILRCADKFLDEKRDKLIDFFWNIDLGKIFCISASDITALSFQNTKTINYTKIPKVIEPKLNSQILELLYSQKIKILKTSHSFTSMAYFLMNRFTQPYYNRKTKEKIFSMISRRVKSKFFLTKLSLIGQQHLSKGSKFDEPKFCGLIRYRIENHYINFMPFLQAMSSNRIYIMVFNDFKWFSQIIQTTQTTQKTQTTSSQKKTGKLLDTQLAELVESVQNILFCESKDLCFKFSMFFVVYYVQSVLFEKNHGCEYDLIDYIFKDNPEIPKIIHYIMNDSKMKTLETLQETKHDYYQIIKTYGKKFCYIAGSLENFYDGVLDLPISQLFDEGVMSNGASPLQKIVFYILNN
jgi:hypothetical protein